MKGIINGSAEWVSERFHILIAPHFLISFIYISRVAAFEWIANDGAWDGSRERQYNAMSLLFSLFFIFTHWRRRLSTMGLKFVLSCRGSAKSPVHHHHHHGRRFPLKSISCRVSLRFSISSRTKFPKWSSQFASVLLKSSN